MNNDLDRAVAEVERLRDEWQTRAEHTVDFSSHKVRFQGKADAANEILTALRALDAATCTWRFHADPFRCVWNKTECGINDAAFGEEDRFKFCPYCGGKILRDKTTVEEAMQNA